MELRREASTPTGVRHLRKSEVVEITWEDGHVSRFAQPYLRGWCPCAQCQGHGGPVTYREGADATLAGLETVGNYALRPRWTDGHDTGLYTWENLRLLCPCEGCAQDRVETPA